MLAAAKRCRQIGDTCYIRVKSATIVYNNELIFCAKKIIIFILLFFKQNKTQYVKSMIKWMVVYSTVQYIIVKLCSLYSKYKIDSHLRTKSYLKKCNTLRNIFIWKTILQNILCTISIFIKKTQYVKSMITAIVVYATVRYFIVQAVFIVFET